MALKTYPFDSSRYLDSEDSQRELLIDAISSGDGAYLVHALGVVARARGMTSLTEEAGVPRDVLYKAVADDTAPDMETLSDVLKRLGVERSTMAAE